MKIGEKWQNNEKWGIIFWGKVQIGIRSTPLYRCFQRANFDTPHGHYEFSMQFWPTKTEFHAVLHLMELWSLFLHKSFTPNHVMGGPSPLPETNILPNVATSARTSPSYLRKSTRNSTRTLSAL